MTKPPAPRRRRSDELPIEMRTSDSQHWVATMIIVACLVGIAIWVGTVSAHITSVGDKQANTALRQAREATQLQDAKSSLLDACNRLNQVRRSDNAAHLGTFKIFQFVVVAQATQAQKQAEASQHLTKAQKALVNAEIQQIKATAAAQSWTPIQNCRAVIAAHGSHYSVPTPISFLTKLPPKSALLLPPPPKKKRAAP